MWEKDRDRKNELHRASKSNLSLTLNERVITISFELNCYFSFLVCVYVASFNELIMTILLFFFYFTWLLWVSCYKFLWAHWHVHLCMRDTWADSDSVTFLHSNPIKYIRYWFLMWFYVVCCMDVVFVWVSR